MKLSRRVNATREDTLGNFHRQAPSISRKYHNFELDRNNFFLLDLVNIVSESSKSIAGSSEWALVTRQATQLFKLAKIDSLVFSR